jgi:transcriptional regulator with XRE-family HTH domain
VPAPAPKQRQRSLEARRIEEVRTAKKLSRQQLADLLGTTRLQVWRLENGVTRVPADMLARIAELLDVSVGLLHREGRAAS